MSFSITLYTDCVNVISVEHKWHQNYWKEEEDAGKQFSRTGTGNHSHTSSNKSHCWAETQIQSTAFNTGFELEELDRLNKSLRVRDFILLQENRLLILQRSKMTHGFIQTLGCAWVFKYAVETEFISFSILKKKHLLTIII